MSSNQLKAASIKIISARKDKARHYASPIKMGQNLWAHRELIKQFTKREVLQTYKGSYLGLGWSLVTPLATLAVYTFAFSVVLGARWQNGNHSNSHLEFALVLFAGLIVFNVFAETASIAPRLIISNRNYVTKVIFPLEILPIAKLGGSLTDSLLSIFILLLGEIIFLQQLPWTTIFLPLVYLPLIFLCLGIGWFMASLGVYIRDVGNMVSVIVRMLLFLTPIFYPVTLVPENIRLIIYLNPLTFIVENFRRVLLFNQPPDWVGFFAINLITIVICLLGYIWFMKSKKTFADVL
jgi:lipopolysaccharide transport system permease protein